MMNLSVQILKLPSNKSRLYGKSFLRLYKGYVSLHLIVFMLKR